MTENAGRVSSEVRKLAEQIVELRWPCVHNMEENEERQGEVEEVAEFLSAALQKVRLEALEEHRDVPPCGHDTDVPCPVCDGPKPQPAESSTAGQPLEALNEAYRMICPLCKERSSMLVHDRTLGSMHRCEPSGNLVRCIAEPVRKLAAAQPGEGAPQFTESFETELTTNSYAGQKELGNIIADFPYGVRLKRAYVGMEEWKNGDKVRVTIARLATLEPGSEAEGEADGNRTAWHPPLAKEQFDALAEQLFESRFLATVPSWSRVELAKWMFYGGIAAGRSAVGLSEEQVREGLRFYGGYTDTPKALTSYFNALLHSQAGKERTKGVIPNDPSSIAD